MELVVISKSDSFLSFAFLKHNREQQMALTESFESPEAFDEYLLASGSLPTVWEYVFARARMFESAELADALLTIQQFVSLQREEERFCVEQAVLTRFGVPRDATNIFVFLTQQMGMELGYDFAIRDQTVYLSVRALTECLISIPTMRRATIFAMESMHMYDLLTQQIQTSRFEWSPVRFRDAPGTQAQKSIVLFNKLQSPRHFRVVVGTDSQIMGSTAGYQHLGFVECVRWPINGLLTTCERLLECMPDGLIASTRGQDWYLCTNKTFDDLKISLQAATLS